MCHARCTGRYSLRRMVCPFREGDGSVVGNRHGERSAAPRERGAAVLEMAIVSILFFTLLLGIVVFGYLMSFRGSMQQASAEGARAGAPAPRSIVTVSPSNPGGRDNTTVLTRAQAATQQAVDGFDKTCGTDITCTYVIHDCTLAPVVGNDTAALPDCLTVGLTYDNSGTNSLLPEPPLIASLTPDTLEADSTVELNDQ